jgi:hypothetical protein
MHVILISSLCIPQYSVAGDCQTDSLTKYPNTPLGVVEAFIKSDFDGSANEVIGDVNLRMQYVTWQIYPGSDCSSVVRKYKISKITEGATTAAVEVKYHVIANLCGYDSFTKTNKEEIVAFGLIKADSRWKIDYPDPSPFISVLTALNLVKHELSRPYLNDKDDKQIQALKKRIEHTKYQLVKLCKTHKILEK